MIKGLDHLVVVVDDLAKARTFYQALGFTVTPRADHPFGSSNALVQIEGDTFLEILAITAPENIQPWSDRSYSFAGYNQMRLAARAGGTMLVLRSDDADQDLVAFEAAGLKTYDRFDFGREAIGPDGVARPVAFSLAFAENPLTPEIATFTCQNHYPENFWKPDYQRHANGATAISDVYVIADTPERHQDFFDAYTRGRAADKARGGTGETPRTDAYTRGRATDKRAEVLTYDLANTACLRVLTPDAWRETMRDISVLDDWTGARFAGMAFSVPSLKAVRTCARAAGIMFTEDAGRVIIPSSEAFGVCLIFSDSAERGC